jgi:hypothetical protein
VELQDDIFPVRRSWTVKLCEACGTELPEDKFDPNDPICNECYAKAEDRWQREAESAHASLNELDKKWDIYFRLK